LALLLLFLGLPAGLPEETIRSMAVPAGRVPELGLSEITDPFGTVLEVFEVTVPAAQLSAVRIVRAVLSGTPASSSG
jgi:hypothetical protein